MYVKKFESMQLDKFVTGIFILGILFRRLVSFLKIK